MPLGGLYLEGVCLLGGSLPLGGSRKAGGTHPTGMLSSYYYAVFTLTYSESETDN